MFERFDDSARLVVSNANSLAKNHNSTSISVGYIILSCPGYNLSNRVNVTLETNSTEPLIPAAWTPEAKAVLEHTLRIALSMGDNKLSANHILLAAIRLHPEMFTAPEELKAEILHVMQYDATQVELNAEMAHIADYEQQRRYEARYSRDTVPLLTRLDRIIELLEKQQA